jgi:hypothetical protein
VVEQEFPELNESQEKLKDYIKALSEKIEQSSESDWKLHFARGKAFYGLRLFNDAEKDFKESIKILTKITNVDLSKLEEIRKNLADIETKFHKAIESMFLTLAVINFKENGISAQDYISKANMISGDNPKYKQLDSKLRDGLSLQTLAIIIMLSFCAYLFFYSNEYRKVGIVARIEDRSSILTDKLWNFKVSDNLSNNIYIGESQFFEDNTFEKKLIIIGSDKYSDKLNEENKGYNSKNEYKKIIGKTYYLNGNYIIDNGNWRENITQVKDYKKNVCSLDSIPKGVPLYGNYHTEFEDGKIISFNHHEIEIVETDKKNNKKTRFLMWDGENVETKELYVNSDRLSDKIMNKIKSTFPFSLIF